MQYIYSECIRCKCRYLLYEFIACSLYECKNCYCRCRNGRWVKTYRNIRFCKQYGKKGSENADKTDCYPNKPLFFWKRKLFKVTAQQITENKACLSPDFRFLQDFIKQRETCRHKHNVYDTAWNKEQGKHISVSLPVSIFAKYREHRGYKI